MEDRHIQILMDEGWEKMNGILDKELPQIQKRKRRPVFWIVLPFLMVVGYWLVLAPKNISEMESQLPKNEELNVQKEIDRNSFALNTQITTDDDNINVQNVPSNENVLSNNTYSIKSKNPVVDNIMPTQSQKMNPLFLKSKEKLKVKGNTVFANSSEIHEPLNSNVNPNVSYLSSAAEQKNETLISDENTSLKIEVTRLFQKKSQVIYTSKYPEISKILPISNDKKLTAPLYLSLNTLLNTGNSLKPGGFALGVSSHIKLYKRLYLEAQGGINIFNSYTRLLKDNSNSAESNTLVSNDPNAAPTLDNNSVYVKSSNGQTINDIDALNESILYNSVDRAYYATASLYAGFVMHPKFTVSAGVKMQRFISAAYYINDYNKNLFKTIDNSVISLEKLESGNSLIRKWIPSLSLGADYRLASGIALGVSGNVSNLRGKSTYETQNQSLGSSSGFVLDKTTSEINKIPNGDKWIELGIKFDLK